jgi:hypothetical protein
MLPEQPYISDHGRLKRQMLRVAGCGMCNRNILYVSSCFGGGHGGGLVQVSATLRNVESVCAYEML